jgi:GrpB-like predicted nucleotidyltransferase (UPF0157 family)
MSDEIKIVPYNSEWPLLFQKEKAELLSALDDLNILEIAHVGSTAVPKLSAKPIIDMMLIVKSLSDAKEMLISPLSQLDYVYWPDNPKTDRMFFVKGMPPYGKQRTHHIHVFETGHEEIAKREKFISILKTDEFARKEYQTLKLKLAEMHNTDREAYTEAKTDFIQKYLD